MDSISNTSNTTVASSSLPHSQQQQAMVESLPTPNEDRRNLMGKQQTQATSSSSGERKPRPQHDEALKCPRCGSTYTKFCYYNNSSMMQPRYNCKACRRKWTQGGTLRDVPCGGGSRKNKRNSAALSSSATATSSSNTTNPATNSSSNTHQPMMTMPAPLTTLGFSSLLPTFTSPTTGSGSFEEHNVSLPFVPFSSLSFNETPEGSRSETTTPFLDLLTGGFLDGNDRSNGNSMPMPFSLPSFDAMPMHATQLVGPLQEQGGSNATTGGLQQWWPSSSQHRSINDGGFAAGSSSAAVLQQQQQHVDRSAQHQEHRATIMDFWSDSTGSVLGTGGSSDAYTNSAWQGGFTNNKGSFDRS